MEIITHKNMQPFLDRLADEPCFQCGSHVPEPTGAWFRKEVTLEFPMGELARGGLSAMALVGRQSVCPEPLTGKEAFSAQGLEGKIAVRRDLFGALMALRDILPENRGRILVTD